MRCAKRSNETQSKNELRQKENESQQTNKAYFISYVMLSFFLKRGKKILNNYSFIKDKC